MDSEVPLSRLVLRAGSLAEDLSFVALGDVSNALGDVDNRVIGGHMVQLHVHRWGLGPGLYRETQDADVGVPLAVAQDPSLIDRLLAMGYRRLAGNSFGRELDDMPVGGSAERRAVVDMLVPAHTSRPRQNRKIGRHLITTEVPGLAEAFKRPATILDLQLTRLNGDSAAIRLSIPDELRRSSSR